MPHNQPGRHLRYKSGSISLDSPRCSLILKNLFHCSLSGGSKIIPTRSYALYGMEGKCRNQFCQEKTHIFKLHPFFSHFVPEMTKLFINFHLILAPFF